MEDKELEEKNKAIQNLSEKCAEFFISKKFDCQCDIEGFIVAFLLAFENMGYYETLGILEEAKLQYRDIALSPNEEDGVEA